MSRPVRVAVAIVGLVLAGVLLRLGVLWAGALPDGPQPVAWDRVACARCRMLVGAPAYAAQLQTRGGAVLDFDDPGCLLLHLHGQAGEIHAVYLHHREEERWLSSDEVGFLASGPSPMGYDLGAVERSRSGALSWEQALDHTLRHEAGRRARQP